MSRRLCLVWLCLLLFAAAAAAGASGMDWRVTVLALNEPATGGIWYGARSPLARSLAPYGGVAALYAVRVWPGSYTLQLVTPVRLQRAGIYLFDRWPRLPGSRRIPLPTGPVLLTHGQGRATYRWRVGISPHSTGHTLFIAIAYPRGAMVRRMAPRLELFSPPLEGVAHIGRGINYLSGPRALILHGGQAPLMYVYSPASPRKSLPFWSAPGGLVVNGGFRHGLAGWRQSGDGALAGGSHGGLQLLPGGSATPVSVTQRIDHALGEATDVTLSTDFRLGRRNAKAATRLAIRLCYRDAKGGEVCGEHADVARFAALPAGTKADRTVRPVPAGQWVHFRFDLLRLPHRPVRIISVSLRGAGEGPVWVRSIHIAAEGIANEN